MFKSPDLSQRISSMKDSRKDSFQHIHPITNKTSFGDHYTAAHIINSTKSTNRSTKRSTRHGAVSKILNLNSVDNSVEKSVRKNGTRSQATTPRDLSTGLRMADDTKMILRNASSERRLFP